MEKLDNNNIESEQEEGTEKSFVLGDWEVRKFDLLFSRESAVTSPLTATEKKSFSNTANCCCLICFLPSSALSD